MWGICEKGSWATPTRSYSILYKVVRTWHTDMGQKYLKTRYLQLRSWLSQDVKLKRNRKELVNNHLFFFTEVQSPRPNANVYPSHQNAELFLWLTAKATEDPWKIQLKKSHKDAALWNTMWCNPKLLGQLPRVIPPSYSAPQLLCSLEEVTQPRFPPSVKHGL